jgi:hypothetical protein
MLSAPLIACQFDFTYVACEPPHPQPGQPYLSRLGGA